VEEKPKGGGSTMAKVLKAVEISTADNRIIPLWTEEGRKTSVILVITTGQGNKALAEKQTLSYLRFLQRLGAELPRELEEYLEELGY
jgi:hypothetical protein